MTSEGFCFSRCARGPVLLASVTVEMTWNVVGESDGKVRMVDSEEKVFAGYALSRSITVGAKKLSFLGMCGTDTGLCLLFAGNDHGWM